MVDTQNVTLPKIIKKQHSWILLLFASLQKRNCLR